MSHRFEVGKTYQCRSWTDYDTIYTAHVISRTAKKVRVCMDGREDITRVVKTINGDEYIKPFGIYSMSPTLWAKPMEDSRP